MVWLVALLGLELMSVSVLISGLVFGTVCSVLSLILVVVIVAEILTVGIAVPVVVSIDCVTCLPMMVCHIPLLCLISARSLHCYFHPCYLLSLSMVSAVLTTSFALSSLLCPWPVLAAGSTSLSVHP